MKNVWLLVLLPVFLLALPEGMEVTAGSVEAVREGAAGLKISASDGAILEYQRFHIGEGERVEFIQPSSKSSVLNRVVGSDPSSIFGSLQANGRVFLVNPHGIYFSPTASVNVGSLIASTLNIADEDFANNRYRFFLENKTASILNEGSLSAEGAIALLAPVIENKGMISAGIGTALLLSGEKIVLDFSGDGMLRFVIEQALGPMGQVMLPMLTARELIKSVVNLDGVVEATAMEEINGVIRLVAGSQIEGCGISLAGPAIEAVGSILDSTADLTLQADAVRIRDSSETPWIASANGRLTIESNVIDIVAMHHSDSLFSSGQAMSLVSDAPISADAHFRAGNGFCLLKPDGSLGDFTSLYDPIISATGGVSFGAYNGVALKVEATGPITVGGNITITGPDVSLPSGDSDSAILQSSAALILRSGLLVLENFGLPVPPPEMSGGATFSPAVGVGSTITLNGSSITTASGPVILDPGSGLGGVALGANVAISTSGGAVTITGMVDGPNDLTISAGSGTVLLSGSVGVVTPLANLTVSSSGNLTIGNIGAALAGVSGTTALTTSGALTFAGTIYRAATQTYTAATQFGLGAGSVVSFLSTSSPITFTGAPLRSSGLSTLTINAGTGNASVAGVGAALGEFASVSLIGNDLLIRGNIYTAAVTLTPAVAGTIFLGGGIATNAGPIVFSRPVIRDTTNNVTLSTGIGANVIFTSTVNADMPGRNLTIAAGTGTLGVNAVIGGTTPLTSFAASAGAINLSANITTNNGPIDLTGPISLLTNIALNTGAGTGSISCSSTIDGAQNLTLTAGTGSIHCAGAIGGGTPLGAIQINSALNANFQAITADSLVQTAGTGLTTLSGPVNTSGAPGVQLTGSAFAIDNAINTAAAGPVLVNNSSALSFGPASSVTALGSFAQSGVGSVSLGGPISATGISFNGSVLLNRSASLTATANNIAFAQTVDGPSALTLTAGSGNVLLFGDLGSSSRLGAFQVVNAVNITAVAIHAGSIQTMSTGTTTLNGALDTNTPAGIQLTGNNINRSAPVFTTNGGSCTQTNSGALVISTATPSVISGAYVQNGTGSVSVAEQVTTASGLIHFTTPVTLTGACSFSSGPGLGDITFASTVDGGQNLTLTAGTGNIGFSGAVGGVTRIGVLQINSAQNVTAGAITAASIVQNMGEGTALFGALNTNTAPGIELAGTNITLSSTVTTTAAGPVLVDNAGTLVVGGAVNAAGAFTQSGLGPVSLGANITTNGDIAFTGPVLLTNTVALGSGGASDISFASAVNGAQGLALTAGTGDIDFVGAVGGVAPLGALQINSAADVSANAITASSIQQVAGSGSTSFNGALTTSGGPGINLTGTAFNFNAPVVTTGTGPVSIANAGALSIDPVASFLLDGAFTQSGAGAVTLGADITTTNDTISFAAPVTLSDDLSLNSGPGIGNLSFASTLNGAYALNLIAGAGNISLTGAVGGVTPLGPFVIASAVNVTAAAISADSVTQVAGTGTTTLNGAVTTTDLAGIDLTGTNFAINGTLSTQGEGPISIDNAGSLSLAAPISIDGNFSQIGSGLTTLSANITTVDDDISFAGPVSLGMNVALSTGTGVGDISFGDTVDGTQNLTLTAGLGSVTLGAPVGSGTPLGALSIVSATNVDAETIMALSLTQSAGSGTTTLHGAVSTTSTISLTGTNIEQQSSLMSGSSIAVNNTGTFTVDPGANATSTNSYTQGGLGPVSLGGNVTTSSAAISFTGPVTLTSSVAMNATSAPIGFSRSIDGGFNLSLTAGAGTISLTGAVGGTTRLGALSIVSANNVTAIGLRVSTLTQIAGSGATTFNGPIDATGNINLTGTTFIQNSSITGGGLFALSQTGAFTVASGANTTVPSTYTQSNSGGTISLSANITASQISLAAPTTLGGAAALTTGSGNIVFPNTVNGGQNLTLTAGTGDVSFGSPVGGAMRLGELRIVSANNVTLGAVTAASIVQLAGTGVTLVSGALDTNTVDGIHLTGAAITLNNTVTTTGGGPLVIVNSGALTLGGALNLAGYFAQSGSGNVSLSAGITTANAPISFASPVGVTTAVLLSSGGGNILFSGTLNGSGCPTLNAGTGTVTFEGAVGAVTPLGCLTASGSAIDQDATVQSSGAVAYTGVVHLGGSITTNTQNITLTGNVIRNINNTAVLNSNGGGIFITGTVNGDIPGRNLTLTAGSGSITLGGTVGAVTPLATLNASGGIVSVANIGGTSSGTSTSTILQSTGAIHFTGTTYTGTAQSYTAGTTFDMDAGATTTFTSFNTPIAFSTGTIQLLAAGTNLIVNTNGSNAILTPLLGSLGQDVTINAQTGTVTVAQMGVNPNDLNVVTLTGTIINHPDPIFATTLILNSPTITVISSNVVAVGALTYNTPVVIAATPISITTCPGGGTITFNQTLDADGALNTRNLTIDVCGADIAFNNAVGSIAPLTSLTLLNANNVTVGAPMRVGALSSTSTGITTINGEIDTTGSAGIQLTGATINCNHSMSTVGGGPLTIANSGTLTLGVGVGLSLDGPFTQSSGPVSMGGSLFTTADDISFGGAVSLTGATSLDTTTGPGDISFLSTINGGQNLTLDAGTGDIHLMGAVGGVMRLGVVHITSAHDVTAAAITAASIVQTAGSGTTTFNGALDTNAAAGIHLTGSAFVFNAGVTTTNAGLVSVANAGTLTLTAAAVMNLNGSFSQTGAGSVLSADSITTANQPISFASAISLTGSTAFNSGGGDIALASTVNGGSGLTLTAGAGDITLSGAIGSVTRTGALLINSAHDLTCSSLRSTTITLASSTGTATFNGALDATGAITLAGNVINQNNSLTTSGGGAVMITNAGRLTVATGATSSIDGAYLQNGAGPVSFSGGLTTTNDNITFTSATTLIGTATLNTGPGAGNILYMGALDGAHNLTLTAGTGDVTFTGPVGATTRLGAIEIVSATNVSMNSVNAAAFTIDAASAATTIGGALNTNTAAGIHMTGNVFVQNAPIVTTNGGPCVINNAGTLTVAAAGISTISGAYSQTGSGGVSTAGRVTTADAPILFTGAVTLTGPVTWDTGSGPGDISCLSTIDGGQDLVLNAGAGSISCAGAIGSGTRIGALTILTTANATFSAVTAASIEQGAGMGTTTFNNTLNTNTASGIRLVGTNFMLLGATTTTASGPVRITNEGTLTLGVSSSFNVSGSFIQDGAGPVVSGASITTASNDIRFLSPITLIGPTSLNSGGGDIVLAGTVNGAQNLSLTAGAGDIVLEGAVGGTTRIGTLLIVSAADVATNAITAGAILQSAGAGTTAFGGALNTNISSGINLALTSVVFDGPITTTNGGPLLITDSGTATFDSTGTYAISGAATQIGAGAVFFQGTLNTSNQPILISGPVTLTGTSSFNSGSGVGNLTFSSTIDGAEDLTVAAGLGSISFGGAIGGITPLRSLHITSAANVTALAISTGTLTQSAGTGTTTFNGAIVTTAPGGVSLAGAVFVFNGTTTTTNGGPVLIANAGPLTISPGADLSLAGSFTQTGSGGVSLGADITTDNGSISFAAPVTLTGPSILDSGTGSGNILFSNTVDGGFNLTLIAGAGNVTALGSVGGATRLGTLQITSANNASFANVTAGRIALLASTDTATFQALDTNTASGISLTGTTINLNGSITTTAGGSVAVNNAGALTFGTADVSNLAGSLVQSGAGPVILGGHLTTSNANISFAGPVSLNGLVFLDTGPGAGNILFSNTVDGSGGLDLTAGTGTVVFDASIGQTTPLSSLTIHSASSITLQNIGTSLQAGVLGPVSLTSSGVVDFAGFDYNAGSLFATGSAIQFTAGVPIAIILSGSLDLEDPVTLSTGSDLAMHIGGNVTLPPLNGTTNENLTINAGGSVSLGNVGTLGGIDEIVIAAGGFITITGPITATGVNFLGNAGIVSPGSPPVTTTEDSIFNAPHGDVGSIADPIGVVAGGKVFTGTQFNGTAVFSGSTSDNTIHVLPADPPAILIFNGVYLINAFQVFPSASGPFVILPYVQGIYSHIFNLSSYFYVRAERLTPSAYSESAFPLLSWTPCTLSQVESCRRTSSPVRCTKLWTDPHCQRCNLKKRSSEN